ncbi:MAG: hypothetical protein BWY76_02045 [bacterium ADurb.Bin429]|nr:MAG: hypothetical protein BWY76_02045 [bacterium ADurb.Bin429]
MTLPDTAGRVPVKIVSTARPLDGAAIEKAVPAARTDAYLAALRASVGAGLQLNHLPTADWADTLVWIDVQ